ncbi:MAG: hypothetical protein HQK52_13715 [Oligoflexia bacterium]|nr:hypothetical protein [Oligoflexia bacterium]
MKSIASRLFLATICSLLLSLEVVTAADNKSGNSYYHVTKGLECLKAPNSSCFCLKKGVVHWSENYRAFGDNAKSMRTALLVPLLLEKYLLKKQRTWKDFCEKDIGAVTYEEFSLKIGTLLKQEGFDCSAVDGTSMANFSDNVNAQILRKDVGCREIFKSGTVKKLMLRVMKVSRLPPKNSCEGLQQILAVNKKIDEEVKKLDPKQQVLYCSNYDTASFRDIFYTHLFKLRQQMDQQCYKYPIDLSAIAREALVDVLPFLQKEDVSLKSIPAIYEIDVAATLRKFKEKMSAAASSFIAVNINGKRGSIERMSIATIAQQLSQCDQSSENVQRAQNLLLSQMVALHTAIAILEDEDKSEGPRFPAKKEGMRMILKIVQQLAPILDKEMGFAFAFQENSFGELERLLHKFSSLPAHYLEYGSSFDPYALFFMIIQDVRDNPYDRYDEKSSIRIQKTFVLLNTILHEVNRNIIKKMLTAKDCSFPTGTFIP